MLNREYVVKNIEATSEYQGVIYTQKVEISFNNKTCWLEDNLMLVNKTMNVLPKNILPRINANGIYKSEEDVPLNKLKFTFCCTIKQDNFVSYNDFDYFFEESFSSFHIGDKVWLSIYLKDLVLIN